MKCYGDIENVQYPNRKTYLKFQKCCLLCSVRPGNEYKIVFSCIGKSYCILDILIY